MQKKKVNVMLDLETIATDSNAVVFAIGAVVFDINGSCSERFQSVCSLRTAIAAGGTVDGDTLAWWMKQSDEARALFNKSTHDHLGMLKSFESWLHDVVPDDAVLQLWGNGVANDNVWLKNAYEREGMMVPWSFWEDRCYRTIRNSFEEIEFERIGEAHIPLNDAISQAFHLIKIVRANNLTHLL